MVKFSARALLVVIALAVLCSSAPVMADTVDQSFVAMPNGVMSVGGCCALAQTFTAGQSGSLTGFSFLWQVSGNSVQISLSPVVGGLPTSASLSSQFVAPGAYGLNQFILLTQPVPVTSGTQYGIVIAPGAGSSVTIYGNSNNLYSGGSAFLTANGGTSWTPLSLSSITSLNFQTLGQSSGGIGGGGGGGGSGNGGSQSWPWGNQNWPYSLSGPGSSSPVPEPASLSLFGLGILGIALRLRKMQL